MKTSIFIVSHEKDYPYLGWCLRSISQFAADFHEVVLCLPVGSPALRIEYDGCPLRIYHFYEWPRQGMLHHEWLIMDADEICPDSDFILHMDSDCIFTGTVSPADYFVDKKPVLLYARFAWVTKQNENLWHWKHAVERAIGGVCEHEFMRRHPAVHPRKVYPAARLCIRGYTGKLPELYIREQENGYPQGFAEFPTLGEVAWRHFHNTYHWINQETDPPPKSKLLQFWSHGPIDKPQDIWIEGEPQRVVPIAEIHKILRPTKSGVALAQ